MTKNIIIAVLALACVVLGFFALNYYIYYEKQGGMESAMHEMTGELDQADDAAFDAAFLSEMIVHHQGAVTMAEQVLARSQRPELRAFAQAIIDAQSAEIAQMESWQMEWYPSSGHEHEEPQ